MPRREVFFSRSRANFSRRMNTMEGKLFKCFGIGLSRTGTTSLAAALNILGFRVQHFPADACTQDELSRWLRGRVGPLFLSALENYDGIVDTPASCSFDGLDKAYPDSRFILTVRDERSWLRSCEQYWARVLHPFFERDQSSEFNRYVRLVTGCAFNRLAFDAAAFRDAYERHCSRVRAYFAGSRKLIELNICNGDGWDKLCPFLGCETPSQTFPWQNGLP